MSLIKIPLDATPYSGYKAALDEYGTVLENYHKLGAEFHIKYKYAKLKMAYARSIELQRKLEPNIIDTDAGFKRWIKYLNRPLNYNPVK